MSTSMSLQLSTAEANTEILPFERNMCIQNLENYKPDGEKTKSHGTAYHDHQLIFYIVECVIKNEFPFRVTCEVQEAGKFDDIVLFYGQDNKTVCRLIQVKHRNESGKKMKRSDLLRVGPFELKSYFKSYEEILRKHKFEEKFKCKIEDLIMCTNIDFDDSIKSCMEPVSDKIFIHKILYRLKKEKTDLEEMIIYKIYGKPSQEMTTDENNRVSQFLELLKFAVNQPDGDELHHVIKLDIEKCLENRNLKISNIPNQVDIVYTRLFNNVFNFHTNPNVEVVSNNDCMKWLMHASKCSDNRLSVYHDYNMNRLTRQNLSFELDSIIELRNAILNNGTLLLNVVVPADTIFTLMKIIQILKTEEKLFHIVDDNQFVLSTSTLEGDIQTVKIKYLIIHHKLENNLNQIMETIKKLLRNINNNSSIKKIIIICSQFNKNYLTFRENFIAESYMEIGDEINWNDFDLKSQEWLRNKHILFQGYKMEFSKVDISKIQSLIKNDIISNLFYECLEISSCFDDLKIGEMPYFIERQIGLRYKVNCNLFTNKNLQQIFAISNIEEFEFEQFLIKYCLSSKQFFRLQVMKNKEDFDRLCKTYQNKNVLWLHYYNNEFFFKKSSKPMDNLNYINSGFDRYIDIKQLANVNDGTVLIIAEPGMGKSILLSVLTYRAIKQSPGTWVVKIDLNDYTRYFYCLKKENKTFSTEKTVIEFLTETQNLKNIFERELFYSYFSFHNKLIILLDGFDEIAPCYKEIVIDLIKCLKDMKIIRLWISSRPQEKAYLESELNILAFSLIEFTLEDQKMFFFKFWKKRNTHEELREDRAMIFIDQLLKALSESTYDTNKLITGIPLQCRMLAEVYWNHFEKFYYSNAEQPNLPRVLNILELYENFTKKIFDIFIEEKRKIDMTKVVNNETIEIEKAVLIENYKMFGVCTVFTEAYFVFLSKVDRKKMNDYMEKIKQGQEKTGIIHSIKHEDPIFIHRTFAEYFAALWFFDNLRKPCLDNRNIWSGVFKDSSITKKMLIKFLKRNSFKSGNEVFRCFFDRLSAIESVHQHVLNNDRKQLENSLAENVTIAHLLDKFGRNLLHLCAAHEYEDIAEQLVMKGVDTTKKDLLFKWKPVTYALYVKKYLHWENFLGPANKNWSFISKLLVNNENDKSILKLIDNKKETLFIASEKGFIGLVRYLIKQGISVNSKNSYKQTSLHLAADNGHHEICKFIIESKGKINSKDNWRRMPLCYACDKGYCDIVETLLNYGAKIDAINSNKTQLHFAIKNGQMNIVEKFLKYDRSILQKVKFSETLLHEGVESGKIDLVKFLIKNGANINGRNELYNTPLHIALFENNLEIVDLLLNSGADIEAENQITWTPLIIAVQSDNFRMIKTLIDKGADISHCSKNYESIMHYVAQFGSLETLMFLIENEISVNVVNDNGVTPLHAAAWRGNIDIYNCLVNAGADINAVDKEERSLLHFAARGGNVNGFEYFAEREENINVMDINERTPLFEAVSGRHVDVCKYLIQNKNAKVDIVDKDKNTLLHWAAKCSHIYLPTDSVFELLLEKGVDYSLKNNQSETVMDIIEKDEDLNDSEITYYKQLIKKYIMIHK